ncbi:hypothetical protein [Pseudomonas nitroreducens]|uniref:hypothetical protein n=1 Tax=Pseudomonas nitroreducens TaxID=46680 RepID=UPI00187585F3|nr:hypothetical protein [Pseudomonas nitritireducens]
MKRALMLSLFFFTLVAAASTVNELRLAEKRAQLHDCRLAPYGCFSPSVSFASLR